MVENSELLRVPAFADLPDDQIAWFISHSEELRVKRVRHTSARALPRMPCMLCLKASYRGEAKFGGEAMLFSIEPGAVTGVLPFSRMRQFTVDIRSLTDSRGLRFPASLFPELIQKMPELTQRLVGLMSDRIRETTRMEQQRDRLASLGKLSAGLAHELNNPASAANARRKPVARGAETNQGCQPRIGKPRPDGRPKIGNREDGSILRPKRRSSRPML